MKAKKRSNAAVDKNYVYRKPNIKIDFQIKELPWTKKQQQLIQTLQDRDTKCCLIKGAAGTAKSLLSVYCGLQLLKSHKISDLSYVRSVVESSPNRLGFLPGDLEDKFDVYTTPLYEKLEELVSVGVIKGLKEDNRFQAIPINYMRGLNFSGRLMLLDEAQNFHYNELVTAITRIGEYSRIWILGDPYQSDLTNGHREDFVKFYDNLDDEECVENGIRTFEFSEEDIVRSEFCKFVVKKLGVYSSQDH